jgi:DNA-directed RNA polymerase specialized sigma24 family protein
MRDDSEFSEFAETAVTRLRQTAFLLSRDWHLAQDLTQITLAKVYLKWRRVEDPHAYAKKTLLRAFLDHRRRRSSEEVAVAELPETSAAGDQPDLRLTLFEALGHLPPRDRAIVVLRRTRVCSTMPIRLRQGPYSSIAPPMRRRCFRNVYDGSAARLVR